MAERQVLARLRITPAWGQNPPTTTTTILIQQGGEYRIETTEQTGRKRKHCRLAIAPSEAAERLAVLRKSNIPALPISPMVCDGEYIELTIHAETTC